MKSLKIDLFLNQNSQFGVLDYLTKKLMEALERQHVRCRLLSLGQNLDQLQQKIITGGADYTLCFNGVLPDANGNFLCDQLGIPHVAYVVDSANHYPILAKSPNTIIASVDQNACDMFREFQAPDVLFLPHGTEQELTPYQNTHRPYDVVMFSSCLDYKKIQEEWHKAYSIQWATTLDKAVTLALLPTQDSYIDALSKAISETHVDPREVNLIEALTAVELVTRAKDRIALVNSIDEFPVHIFGSGPWQENLDNQNIEIHDPLDFAEALNVMTQSKIVLNSCLWIKRGGHERLFSAMACGAVGATNRNPFLTNYFQDKEEILYYDCQRWNALNEQIRQCLEDEEYRSKIALSGRQKVMQNHTWDHRAATLIKHLESKR